MQNVRFDFKTLLICVEFRVFFLLIYVINNTFISLYRYNVIYNIINFCVIFCVFHFFSEKNWNYKYSLINYISIVKSPQPFFSERLVFSSIFSLNSTIHKELKNEWEEKYHNCESFRKYILFSTQFDLFLSTILHW